MGRHREPAQYKLLAKGGRKAPFSCLALLQVVCHTYCISRRRHNLKPQMTTKPRKLTATAENGEVFTRKTARTYTHAVYLEITYSDGSVENVRVCWAGRSDLAAKSLRETARVAARQGFQGSEVCNWDRENRVYVGTGIFREKIRAVAVPVNS